MSDSINALCLSMIFPSLPEKTKKKVMIDVLSRCGFQISLKDFKTPRPRMHKMSTFPVYKPEYRCICCGVKLLEQEAINVEEQAEALKKHLPNCLIFIVLKTAFAIGEKTN